MPVDLRQISFYPRQRQYIFSDSEPGIEIVQSGSGDVVIIQSGRHFFVDVVIIQSGSVEVLFVVFIFSELCLEVLRVTVYIDR